jgi:transposase
MSTPPRFFNLEESDMGRFIGVDLHRNCFTVCLIAENGREYISAYRLEQIDRFLRKLRATDELAVEVTGNTRLFYELVAPHVARVVVVNPSQFRVIRQSTKKTDKHDAQALALFLSKDLLPEVRMKDKQHAELASLTQTRDTLVKQRTALKNKVNNLLSSRGVNLKKESLTSEKGLRQVLGMKFAPLMEIELEVLVQQIRAINTSVAKLDNTIKEEGAKLPGHKNLKSIKGIGDLGATILLSVIGDVNDFTREGKLAAYFGIVPQVNNSNETERSGRITKRGTKLGRTTLVQCALTAKRYSPYLARFYERIKFRRGTGKAIIALAKKFLGIIYNTLKEDWVFVDFPNFELAIE